MEFKAIIITFLSGISFLIGYLITKFIKDEKKSGGNYIHKTGIIKSINPVESNIKFTDNSTVYINDIINIEILKDN